MTRATLNKYSHIPLYRQLVDRLALQIRSGQLQVGERVPSEREMAETLGVSRTTARLAIEELVASGLVYRDQGRGTFVAEPTSRRVMGFASFSEELVAHGRRPGSRILEQLLVDGDESIRATLKLQGDEKALRLVRLRLADDKPIALQTSHVAGRLVPGLESKDMTDQSLHRVLREDYFVYPEWTEAEIGARRASANEAELLNIEVGDPVLLVHGRAYTDSFEPVEVVTTVYHGDELTLYFGRQRINPMRGGTGS
ncbi:MAG: GntR family transcriptional regulator [Anaerolineae bacterium]|nr:GntR family transcriptional regulator [Anaerolineae bacterium]